MKAYRISHVVIAADIPDDARNFFVDEMGCALPAGIEEIHESTPIPCPDGTVKTVRERIDEELDARNVWLRMGVPCDLHWPFIIGFLK